MSDKVRKIIRRYLISTGLALIASFGLLYSFDFFSGELSYQDGLKAVADAFGVVGILLLSFGSLVYVSTEGMFDGVSYAAKVLVRALIPGGRRNPMEKYGDYKVAKSENRFTGYGFLFIVGVLFTLIGGIFTALYLNA